MNDKLANNYTETRKVIPGVCSDAKTLNVTRQHLWRVLAGKKPSPKLMARYLELKKRQEAS